MNTNAKGAKLERRARDLFKENSAAFIVRAAGSFGPVDLVLFYEGTISTLPFVKFVQVKSNKWPSEVEFNLLAKMSKTFRAEALVVRYDDGIKIPKIKSHPWPAEGVWTDFVFVGKK